MQHEHPAERAADGPGRTSGEGVSGGPAVPREFWVRVRIDGVTRVIRVVEASPQDAIRRFGQDMHRGARLRYATSEGELTVEWGNVATLEVGSIVRVVRVVDP
jgi:hypothetical protein